MKKLSEGALELGIGLAMPQLELFETYYRELVAANEKMNLTAITGYEEAQTVHFLDSLTVLAALPQNAPLKVIDVGSGAGLPGLPLRIARPDIELTLLDATAKKTGFLEKLTATLGLDGIEIINGRAETLAHDVRYREVFDVALARAVASLGALAELCLPFCRVGGVFIAQKKGDIAGEIAEAGRAIEILGGRLREVRPVKMEEFRDERCLVIIDKVGATPPEYARRPGMPVKRPLK